MILFINKNTSFLTRANVHNPIELTSKQVHKKNFLCIFVINANTRIAPNLIIIIIYLVNFQNKPLNQKLLTLPLLCPNLL